MALAMLPDSFLRYIEPEPNTGCWFWSGGLSSNGYGAVCVRSDQSRNGWRTCIAHRAVYEQLRGPIPAGLTLDHLCRQRSCVNPSHLEAVSLRENLLRGVGFAARYASQTTCKRGHNDWRKVRGGRSCRSCARAHARVWMQQARDKKKLTRNAATESLQVVGG